MVIRKDATWTWRCTLLTITAVVACVMNVSTTQRDSTVTSASFSFTRTPGEQFQTLKLVFVSSQFCYLRQISEIDGAYLMRIQQLRLDSVVNLLMPP